MDITIYHNPRWGKSRESVKILDKKCNAFTIIDYQKEKLSVEEISKIIEKKNFDSVVSITDVNASHPYRMKVIRKGYLKDFMKFKSENMIPRQKLPKIYIRSGSFYIIKRDVFFKKRSLVGNKTYGFSDFINTNKIGLCVDNVYEINVQNLQKRFDFTQNDILTYNKY